MKKIAISKAIAVKDWKGTSSSLGAFLQNASMAGAPRAEHREVCPRCCNIEWATLRFAEPLSADELSTETEAGPMVQKIRESNHLVCNYKHLPAQNCFWAFCLPGRRFRNTLGFMFKSCWRRWNTCKHVFRWSTEAILFWALEISKWDKFLNQPAVFFGCNRCRLFTAQLLLEMGPQTYRAAHDTQIENNLRKCTIHGNHSICHHWGYIIKSTLITASG